MIPDPSLSPQVIHNATGEVVDLAIIGAGPVGLFGAFYAGMRQMSVMLIDSLEQLGGQLTALYPEKYIFDVAGFPRVLAKELAANLIAQAMQARPQIVLGEQVRTLSCDDADRTYTILTDKGNYRARAVLIAAGAGAFMPKTLPLPQAKQLEGRGLYYFVRDIAPLRGRRVLIVGGGDSAVDWANTLAPVADVTLVHRRDVFRAHEASVAQLHRSSVRVRLFHELKDIGGDGRVERAVIVDTKGGQEETLAVDAVLVNIGFESSLGPIRHWCLTLDRAGILVDSTMQTNRPGVFAAGDVAVYPGKLKLIVTGFGEATTAVNHAKRYLDPSANLFPGHSTSVAAQRLPSLAKPG